MAGEIRTDPIDQLGALLDMSARREAPAGLPRPFPIVAAIADDQFAATVLGMTHVLVRELGASPTILKVAKISLHPAWDTTGTVGVWNADLVGPAFQAQCAQELRRRFDGDHGIASDWPIDVRIGDVASSVEACAHETGSELVVMGLHRHGRFARAVGDDTVHEVVNTSTVPVLALRPTTDRLPRRILVAMDFSAASLRAARLARRLIDPLGIIDLAYVRSGIPLDDTEQSEGLRAVELAGIDASFRRVVRTLAATHGMTISCITLQGDPAEALKVLADGTQADLIAIGSQTHRWLDRLMLGSVARAIVREGRWSTLVTPPAARMAMPISTVRGTGQAGGSLP